MAGNAPRIEYAVARGGDLGDEGGGRGVDRRRQSHRPSRHAWRHRKRRRESGSRHVNIARRIYRECLYGGGEVSREEDLRGIRVELHHEARSWSGLQRIAQRQQGGTGRPGDIQLARRIHRQIVRLVRALSAKRGEQHDLARRVQLHDKDASVAAAGDVSVPGRVGHHARYAIVVGVSNIGGEIGGRQSGQKAQRRGHAVQAVGAHAPSVPRHAGSRFNAETQRKPTQAQFAFVFSALISALSASLR